MHARLTDPNGPAWTRGVVPAIGLALTTAALMLPQELEAPKLTTLFVGASILILGPLFFGRYTPRDVELHLGAGFVEVKRAGALNQTLRARDVVSGSAARTPDGVTLALTRRSREGAPLTLALRSDDEAKAVRDALGIGHFGAGMLWWATSPRAIDRWAAAARIAGGICFLLLAAAQLVRGFTWTASLISLMVLPPAALVLLSSLFSKATTGTCLAFQAAGVSVNASGTGWSYIPYAQIAGASTVPEGIRIDVHGAPPVVVAARASRLTRRGMSDEERAHAVHQLLSATERARGAGEPPANVDVGARVAELARRDEPARTWLARLDATAATMGSGYRGTTMEPADLWATLGDHDAPADLRAAAARVLLRVAPDEAPARVNDILAAVREEPVRKRISLTMDADVEEAGEELEALDASEARASSRSH